ncbi:hypothetical protein H112_08966 [Trichophyton rubrum D6]|uniref:Low temperature requirement A n=2 Tax=Trichophyton rubrum TaxID=5551 RepID=F2SCY3_TRIRC|nr:uncharacterized protein TERG_01511 [Trichophyton rubrum CBS 118892]EZF09678.1 hypothetical protein H100_08989 [Trichophyton rubrum MR850]EZF36507.1 hypothetical protein H102_08947 [Trichophyton rubrum CBS 100081]EZF47185.1 hypothetical protein H103_08970 [Trichophyton rubrum CBS 288.86]EZF57867.1 hypothetical protein H104_08918 [Trichophyton rubrum CBS 289.86]EZF79157.1 hypothetical protein H110_08970 [Trichophyton rubrum MR1448]EZF89774.1 hypothetical protein H113_09035 [Trichophyton rubr
MRLKNIFRRNYTESNWRKPLPFIESPIASEDELLEKNSHGSHDGTHADARHPGEADNLSTHDGPVLKKNHEATTMELFYDLFFVATLAIFHATHEINTSDSVKSYIAFITILWFCWLQAALFDIRFYTDSIISRIFKALHLGIMTGLAVLSVNFSVTNILEHRGRFASMCYLLMVSRFILVAQYTTVAWYLRGHKQTFTAKVLVIATLFVSATVFLALGVSAHSIQSPRVHIAWYVVIACEAVFMIAISSFWKVLSFKGTPIVERFGCLTLIVLGEGIVGMTKAIKSIALGTSTISGTSVSLVICHVLIIYFVYMLYFDQIDVKRFGTIRQQIWALFHYPLHVAILVTSEGSRSFVLYDVAKRIYENALVGLMSKVNRVQSAADLVQGLQEIIVDISSKLKSTDGKPDFTPLYKKLLSFKEFSITSEEVRELLEEFLAESLVWIMHTFGIEVKEENGGKTPKVGKEEGKAAIQELVQISSAATIVFRFFFTAAGLTLVLLAILHWFSKSHKSRAEMLSIIVTTTIGVFLSLLAVMSNFDSAVKESALGNYIDSAWVTPTVALTYIGGIV